MYHTFDNVLNINHLETPHEEYYRTIIDALGKDQVRACIPFSLPQLIIAYQDNTSFNTLPLHIWDRASGFLTSPRGSANVTHLGNPLTWLYNTIGVDSYSNSDGVCILKQAARDMVLEHLQGDNT